MESHAGKLGHYDDGVYAEFPWKQLLSVLTSLCDQGKKGPAHFCSRFIGSVTAKQHEHQSLTLNLELKAVKSHFSDTGTLADLFQTVSCTNVIPPLPFHTSPSSWCTRWPRTLPPLAWAQKHGGKKKHSMNQHSQSQSYILTVVDKEVVNIYSHCDSAKKLTQ